MTTLYGEKISLRLATAADIPALVRIRETDEVQARWRGDDAEADCREAIEEDEVELLAIVHEETVVGAIQWGSEEDPDYAHASLDLYLAPEVHRQGFGLDAIRTLVRFLFDEAGHHRLTIDPAANNHAAIACYAKAGFQRVGILREYERGADGRFHDGLLMELLRTDHQG